MLFNLIKIISVLKKKNKIHTLAGSLKFTETSHLYQQSSNGFLCKVEEMGICFLKYAEF